MRILDPIPEVRILSLLLTLRCNAECENCGTNSSPRVRSRLDATIAKRLISEASELKYQLVAFTGGEATLYGPELFELIEFANALGMSTRLVTNAVWAGSEQLAAAKVKRFCDVGLTEINFSTGDQHARFVKIDNVARAARASIDNGLRVAVMVEVVAGNAISASSLRADPKFACYFNEGELASLHMVESPWMSLDDNLLLRYPDGLATNESNMARRTGCDSVINTITILSDGRMMACCGLGTQAIAELEVGHVRVDDVATVRRRCEGDFLKRWIRAEGPERILAWAAKKDSTIKWENRYVHRCQACKRLYSDPSVRKVIERDYEEKILDVLASEWLMSEFRVEASREEESGFPPSGHGHAARGPNLLMGAVSRRA